MFSHYSRPTVLQLWLTDRSLVLHWRYQFRSIIGFLEKTTLVLTEEAEAVKKKRKHD
jgi:hypothetical protein